ncbi:hypothetical protein B0A50_02917 [Salinomyces thailandicus]|uniref:Uncharacterized protein n=1 Tax=Salinomyces thailandicus TaxID=706561 RepID=A0A4U0U123_9PEZI|nr:hypothetical protein B0A50_02917 [Salinomyces thailandica]
MATAPAPSIDRLLHLAADNPTAVLDHLRAHPQLANQQDAHGYSLLHAATSWNHVELLDTLIREYHVDPNITDEDGETALFNAESVAMAQELLQKGVRGDLRNSDGQTAAEKLEDPDEQPEIAAFLRTLHHDSAGAGEAGPSPTATPNAGNSSLPAQSATIDTNGDGDVLHAPPPLPNGVKVEVGTMQQEEAGAEPDPEFKRRIEELAQRDDFQSPEGQSELQRLVRDIVGGLTQDSEGQGPATRRRVD